MVTICTYDESRLAPESSIEDLVMQARSISYDIIGLAKMWTTPIQRLCDTEELFLGTCDNSGVGGFGVLVNTTLSMNIDSFEQMTTRIGRLWLKKCVSISDFTILVVYAPTSNHCEDEVEAFCTDLE